MHQIVFSFVPRIADSWGSSSIQFNSIFIKMSLITSVHETVDIRVNLGKSQRGKVRNISKPQSLYRGGDLGIIPSLRIYIVGGFIFFHIFFIYLHIFDVSHVSSEL